LAIEDQLLELLSDAVEAGWKGRGFGSNDRGGGQYRTGMHENVLLSVETELRKLMKKRR